MIRQTIFSAYIFDFKPFFTNQYMTEDIKHFMYIKKWIHFFLVVVTFKVSNTNP